MKRQQCSPSPTATPPHTGTSVRCNLCPHGCLIAEGQRGHCRVRENRSGRLFSVLYGNPCAVPVDPIEKKAVLPTPVETLERAPEVAMEEGMRFVCVGNGWGHPGSHTDCPRCGAMLIAREGFPRTAYRLWDGTCPDCGEPIPGVGWP